MSEVEQSVRGGQQGVGVSRPNGSKTKRILLVEEEPLLGVAILNNLRKVGFAVDVASNGTIALEKLRSSAPDAIFLDLMLPNIDSVEVISEARREPEYADLPIYVYTSAFPMKMSRRAAKAGATQIFDKISTPLDEVAAEVASQLIGSSAVTANLTRRTRKRSRKSQRNYPSASAESTDICKSSFDAKIPRRGPPNTASCEAECIWW